MQKTWQKLLTSFAFLFRKTNAFTLAEVLIVLGIIGLIADMTIPTLIQRTQEKTAVVKLKKVHATFENAFRLAVNENGTPDEWGFTAGDGAGALIAMNFIKPYLNILKDCGTGKGCFAPNVNYKHLSGSSHGNQDASTDRAKLVLADGTMVSLWTLSANCKAVSGTSPALQNRCGNIKVDINGDKGPNKLGEDLFYFAFTKYGFIPFGTDAQTDYTFEKDCKDKSTANGYGCTAWIVYNENMDYLHCNDLSWSGKKKCSN